MHPFNLWSFIFFDTKATDAKLPDDADLQVDEEDAWIVENHQLQNWDPVSIEIALILL